MRTPRLFSLLANLLIALACIVPLTAQQAIVNVEGFIKDSATGEPVGCKLHIYSPSNKRVTISSNSKDGSYLQTLSEAGPHKIVASGHNVYRKEFIIDVPKSEKFMVIKRDFTVRAFVEGRLLSSTMSAFDRNAATLSESGRTAVADLADVLRANQHLNVVVKISGDEDLLTPLRAKQQAEYKKLREVWAKAVKKVKKGQPLPEEPMIPADPVDPNVALVESRFETIRQALRDVKLADVRVTFEVKTIVAASAVPAPVTETVAPKGKKGKKAVSAPVPAAAAPSVSKDPNLVVSIGKVKSIFD
jgi:hypothetical protein